MRNMIYRTRDLFDSKPLAYWNRRKGEWQEKPSASCIYPTFRGAFRVVHKTNGALWEGMDDGDAVGVAPLDSKGFRW